MSDDTLEYMRQFLSNLPAEHSKDFDCCESGLVATGDLDPILLISLATEPGSVSIDELPEIYVGYRQLADGPVVGGAFIPTSEAGKWLFVNECDEWPESREPTCPVEVLQALSPTEDDAALVWRARSEKALTDAEKALIASKIHSDLIY